MTRPTVRRLATVLFAVSLARPLCAHPVPFSYLDVRVGPDRLDLTLVAHVYDVGHDIDVQPPERLLDEGTLREHGARFAALVAERMHISADGVPVAIGPWSSPEPLTDRQSLAIRATATLTRPPGVVSIDAQLFPYDPVHQTFVNMYQGDRLSAQSMLSVGRTEFSFYTPTSSGAAAVIGRLAPAGMVHIISGAEHLLILLGLLLVSTSRRQLLLIASSFTIGHAFAVVLSLWNVWSPPARLVEPAIGLSIVYIGIDNLAVRGGRDIRAWISLVLGAIHGFGFASVLRTMSLPGATLTAGIVASHLGIEVGQLSAAVVIAAIVGYGRSLNDVWSRRIALAGSVAVIVAGAFWFVQRVFFPGAVA
jgi:HupE / UreJ protein